MSYLPGISIGQKYKILVEEVDKKPQIYEVTNIEVDHVDKNKNFITVVTFKGEKYTFLASANEVLSDEGYKLV